MEEHYGPDWNKFAPPRRGSTDFRDHSTDHHPVCPAQAGVYRQQDHTDRRIRFAPRRGARRSGLPRPGGGLPLYGCCSGLC